MYKIVHKKQLNPSVVLMDIEAPLVARKARPGQFIILRSSEDGERIPLTIAGSNREAGTVRIIFQIVGATTTHLGRMEVGECLLDFVGPLGEATKTEGLSRVLIVGGGVGCAIALPIAEELHRLGADVTSIIGFRNAELRILEEEFAAASSKVILMTDDGTAGRAGNVTAPMGELLAAGERFDMVFAIGPLVMMKYVVETARPYGVPVTVSMNPIMIDGTGMCGGCRLTLLRDGKRVTKFACVDGPDFNGYEIDFDEAISRGRMYDGFERQAREADCNLYRAADSVEEPKRKIIPKRIEMPVQEPAVRAKNFGEVALGYTLEMAKAEAERCLNCKTRPCVTGCPVNVAIPEFIAAVREDDLEGAYRIITGSSSLPAVCGRVCPQENQCEKKCSLGVKYEPVAIGRLERFVADAHNAMPDPNPPRPESNGHRVAVIGSGPSGLACAGDLARLGYDVTVYEALHMAGGVLVYGIPEFRLPKAIVEREVASLRALGVRIETNVVIGKTLTVDELFDELGFEAIFIGSGAGLPNFMGIPGESKKGVYSANEFLTRSNLMKSYRDSAATPIMKAGKVAVVGGGNVAMDAARTALRLGAESVSVIYRRSMEELPARHEEVEHAMEEGVRFEVLCNPVEILGYENPDDPRDPKNGFVNGMVLRRMELGEPDARGRRAPVPVEGSDYRIDVDCVIIAIGTSPNPLIKNTTAGLEVNDHGGIVVREDALTSRAGVYAGGDAVTGAATVISAMGAGKRAAAAIHESITNKLIHSAEKQ